ncbi:MAG: ABC transporter ATP-binding protein [Treponema sp.]|jgi:ATP-binding cassette subfamily B protein/ATP-binding cassette subfamily C protein|nr:ABC transporter ATP-binding protein [Treponema sp.]
MKLNTVISIAGTLYRLLSKKHKMYLVFLIALTIGLSLLETIGISVIMPFISIAADPALLDSGWYKKIFDLFGFIEKTRFIIALGIVIICFYLFRGAYYLTHIYCINRFSQALYKYFSRKLFNAFLAIPYKLFTQKNSADLMQIIVFESQHAGNFVLNTLELSSELCTVLCVYILMLVMNWKMTLVLTAVLTVIILSFVRFLLRKTKAMGGKRSSSETAIFRILRETFGNFKFVKLKGNEKSVMRVFDSSLETYSRAQVTSNTLKLVPKSILECVGFSLLVAAVIFILLTYRDPAKVIPIVAMYTLAMYRILPSVHRLLGNTNNLVFIRGALDTVHNNIFQQTEDEGAAPIAFEKSIRLENVSFAYVPGSVVLNSVSLEIAKGERVAIIGESGSGKSTLADLITGVNKPSSGTIYIDGNALTGENIRAWRSKIGYIPQSIYLFDGTVAENVAFGSEPDDGRIRRALQQANIWDFLSTKEGLHTLVGEGGIQLSGGQQQRIAIARALYDDPDVLVLDEATSALDTETEIKIMDEIYSNLSRDKTLIVIAHRLSTVERCGRKIRIENGGMSFV